MNGQKVKKYTDLTRGKEIIYIEKDYIVYSISNLWSNIEYFIAKLLFMA